jgi:hypothetical protein
LIRLALCFEHPEFTDEILWAIENERWDLLDSRCLEYITRTVKESSTTTRTFYGLSESGDVFEINIREFDKIRWIWVPKSIEIGFFRTRTDANNYAQGAYQNEIDAYRKAKKRETRRAKKEPMREWGEEDERKASEMVERYLQRVSKQASHAQSEAA